MSQAVAFQVLAPSSALAPGFHLLVEAPDRARPRAAAELPALQIPQGLSYLRADREPRALEARRPRGPAFVLEPVRAGGRPSLLLLSPPEARARLHGLTLPAVALLRTGDQLQLDARAVLHVTEYVRNEAVQPGPELVGSPCGLCRLPLTAETTVHLCSCGLPLHLEGSSRPADARLECALLGDCPTCGAPVQTESSYVWLPEL